MAARPQGGPSAPVAARKLSVEEARFYASVYSSARKGSLGELCRKGCSEEEAEELFSMAFEKVMESVDPIARQFTAPQMVNFIKRAAWRCLIDRRRRQGQRPELELGEVRSLSDPSAESPEEAAEEREAAAIGREALQMLPERDQAIFRQRHQMNLSPAEIVQSTPGLSLRTYRKIIQRANARALEAFERIEGGERCEEMEGELLRRYVGGESPEAERRAVEAHLAHCRSCQQAQARLRGYLLDVAGGLLVATSLSGSGRLVALDALRARIAETAASGAHAFAGANRAARERARELLLRIAGGLPGAGGDATVGQAISGPWVKVASICASGLAAGACVAAGLAPGIGGIGLLENHHTESHRPGRSAARTAPAPEPPSMIDTLPASEAAPHLVRKPRPEPSRRAPEEASGTPHPSVSSSETSAPVPNTPSSARESGSQVGTEFGGGEPITPPAESPASSPPSGSSGSGQSAGGSSHGTSSSEFGL